MKKIDFNNKKTTWWLIIILVVIIIAIILTKKLQSAPTTNTDTSTSSLVDIVNTDNYSEYDGSVSTNFEGESSVDFSFLYQKGITVAKGDQTTCSNVQCFTLTNATGTNNVTLYFTYEGGRGMTAKDYANLLIQDNASGTITDLKFATDASSSIKHVINTDTGYEYYVEAVTAMNRDTWLAIVENKAGNDETAQTVAKDLVRSLKFNSSVATDTEEVASSTE